MYGELDVIASHVNFIVSHLDRAMRRAFDDAMEVGEALCKAKSLVAHGEWTQWMADNLHFTARTARRYMKLWENREQLKTDNVSVLSKAYRFLAEDEKLAVVREKEERERQEWMAMRERRAEEKSERLKRKAERIRQRIAGDPPEDWSEKEERIVERRENLAVLVAQRDRDEAFKNGETPKGWTAAEEEGVAQREVEVELLTKLQELTREYVQMLPSERRKRSMDMLVRMLRSVML